MGKVYEGQLVGAGLKFALIVSRFNEFITSKLLEGARDALTRHGVNEIDVDLVWVPGAFEVPLAALKLARSQRYDAIVCLSAVIRGATPHFEYVSAQVSSGVGRVMLETGVPTAFGVITADTVEQAIERAGSKAGNKGFDAAVTAVEMANLLRALEA